MSKVIKREVLKNKVNEVAPKLPENVVFIAGLRQIKDGQIQVEFAQSRALAGRKASMLALLNSGDARFNSGRTLMRVWLMVNVAGFAETFGIDLAEAAALAKTAGEDEVVGLFQQAETITVNGVKHPVKIVCKETVVIDELPKAIREQIQNPDVEEEIKNRYILQTAEGDRIVDEFGNPVYRRYELTYGTDEDVLVSNKILASELAKKAVGATQTTSGVLNSALAD